MNNSVLGWSILRSWVKVCLVDLRGVARFLPPDGLVLFFLKDYVHYFVIKHCIHYTNDKFFLLIYFCDFFTRVKTYLVMPNSLYI